MPDNTNITNSADTITGALAPGGSQVINTYMSTMERNAIDAKGLYPMEHLSKSFDRLV